jgi:hypothetical protein
MFITSRQPGTTKKRAARVGNYHRSVGRDGDFLTAYASSELRAQLERLLSIDPAGRVLAILLDDISADRRGEYLSVLRFLVLKDDGRLDFHNLQ